MSKCNEDLIGQRFGRLVVIKRAENDKYNHIQFLCKCDCGNETIVNKYHLKNNNIKSCGCLRSETTSQRTKKYNTYDLSGEYGIGYTDKGEEFWFDLEDYDKIKDYYWRLDGSGYLIANDKINDVYILMHRHILDNPDGIVDHIFHDKKDNRKYNLRICSPSQNSMNQILRSDNTSGVKGVNWHSSKNKWRAFIGINGKHIHLGSFTNFEDAVKARKEAEEKYFGEFSYDNSTIQN